jgi:hypothetical protein
LDSWYLGEIMVLIKSTLIAQASGSLAGATFSRNKGGAYMRARVRGTNPNSVSQTRARTALSDFASLFATLTSAQRQTWEQYAEEAVHVNALGDPITQSAISLYIASNTLLLLTGQAAVNVAPVGTTRPTLVAAETATVTYDVSDAEFSVIDVEVMNGGGAGAAALFTSPILTGGQSSFKQRYRYAALLTSGLAFDTGSEERYLYAAGNLFKSRLRYVRSDGAFSEPVYVNGSAVA